VNKLEEFGMTDCKPVGTPMLPGHNLSSQQSPKTPEERQEMENIPYINAVRELMYLAIMMCPDIAYMLLVCLHVSILLECAQTLYKCFFSFFSVSFLLTRTISYN
jgi:hypothetical protein